MGGQVALSFASSTQIFALTPAVTAGATVDVVVTNGDGQSVTLSNAFYLRGDATPGRGLRSAESNDWRKQGGGTYVTLVGAGFDTGAEVLFDGKAATVATRNGAFLGVFTPPHPAGVVNVAVVNSDGQQGTAEAGFTYK